MGASLSCHTPSHLLQLSSYILNCGFSKLESSLDVQTRIQFGRPFGRFQFGIEISAIDNSKLETTLDVQTRIQFEFTLFVILNFHFDYLTTRLNVFA